METRTIVFVGSSSDLLRMLMVQIEIGTNTADDHNNNSNSNWDSSPWGLSSSAPTNWYLYPSIGFLSTNWCVNCLAIALVLSGAEGWD